MLNLRTQVERFYSEIWDRHDKEAIPQLLHEDFTFRGSLGQEKRGHAGFGEYVDMVHAALSHYQCTIEQLVVEPPRAFARMRFEGVHVGPFMNFEPSGKPVRWCGAALFTFEDGLIADVWVLGDIKGLEAVLERNAS